MRATHPKFTVTAGALIFNHEGELLLLKHSFRRGTGWGLPGGFLEVGEQPDEAVRRELREEIGLEIRDPRIFATRSFKKPRQIEIMFLARADGEVQPRSAEIERAAWFALDSLPAGLSSNQRQLIQRALDNGANRRG